MIKFDARAVISGNSLFKESRADCFSRVRLYFVFSWPHGEYSPMAEKDMLINFTNDESHKESYFLNFAQIPRFLSLSILGLTFWWVYLCEG